ncbi:globin domain-containing protein [Reichenbachiella carrageenanivorans]|uniref:Globin domain-containing protein n=1 Tax=Reichenbachiella carrageenanivorans TaxID=2979869 RepID=A0ABY6D442_9BACT|nr:globin domain-containing protein [Reichenbachiella carrageenanivorans]UXX80400.1 globin domain-containing protein [Reichenbachiella carrageenanivorans]
MTNTVSITPYNKRLVRATFWMVESKTDEAAKVFYSKLFEMSPELRPLFKGNMQMQGRKMMEMISTVVKGLNTLDVLAPLVRNMGRRHMTYGIRSEHYNMAAAALMYSLKEELKENWNEEVEAAWLEVYETLSDIMQSA